MQEILRKCERGYFYRDGKTNRERKREKKESVDDSRERYWKADWAQEWKEESIESIYILERRVSCVGEWRQKGIEERCPEEKREDSSPLCTEKR